MSEIKTMPLFLLDGTVPFPRAQYNVDTSSEHNENAIKEALMHDRCIMLVNAKDCKKGIVGDNIFSVGTYAKILNAIKNMDGTIKVTLSGVGRGTVTAIEENADYTLCRFNTVDPINTGTEEETAAAIELLKDSVGALRKLAPLMPKVIKDVTASQDAGEICDTLADLVIRDFTDKRHILEEFDIYGRTLYTIRLMEKEIERARVKNNIMSKARQLMEESQKEYFLREELRAINEELGDKSGIGEEISEYRKKADSLKMPDYALEKLEKEYERLKRAAVGTAETSIIRDYIDNVLALPWGIMSKEKKNLKKAQQILDKDHYGLNDVKDRVLEYLAVRQNVDNPSAPILCLVGPPGVGKTSIAKSIARALGIEYVRISLGGLSDENEIRGHRRTYLGAMPGRIIAAMKQAKVSNPLILLDEIDKLGKDYKGDPAAAFLEILDGEQNVNFRDNYIEMPYDLSKVLFVCTANSLDTVPAPLRDRLEIVELSSYTQIEKLSIAEDYLVPKQLKANGLTKSQLRIRKSAIEEVIDGYTREAGVRNVERLIGTICRKAVKQLLLDEVKSITVTDKNIADFLGKRKFHPDTINEKDEVGICRGLAWTSVGGVTLSVEVNLLKGNGSCKITGNIGKVMEESYNAALSYIKANAGELGVTTDFENTDVHIHIPEGATPKDGPSAGITMATAMVSAMTNTPVRADVAMTGEISIRGRVMPIGGLKEKVLAAKRAGVKKIIIPYENAPDLDEIPDYGKENIEFVLAKQMSDVLSNSIAAV